MQAASSSLAAMSLLASAVARAFGLPPATTPRVHVERDVRLRACDSVVLLTDLYLSRPIAPRQVILIRTPYGRAGAWGLFARGFAQRGYNVVIQSCRGTFGSAVISRSPPKPRMAERRPTGLCPSTGRTVRSAPSAPATSVSCRADLHHIASRRRPGGDWTGLR